MNKTTLLLFILFIACNNKPELKLISFNPAAIVKRALNLQGQSLTKITYLNDKKDSQFIKHPDWSKELDFIKEISTEKPSYKGTLQLDSTNIGDTLKINMICNDSKLFVKKATATYIKGYLYKMDVIVNQNNFLFESNKEITILPMEGYTIKGFQNLNRNIDNKVAYLINGKFCFVKS